MFFDTLSEVIAALHSGIVNGSNSAIAAMCSLVWNNLFGWVAGIVIGFGFLNMLLDDDLISGIRKQLILIITLLILAWFIKPDASGCKVVGLKDDLLAFRAAATSAVAPDYAGDPADLISKTLSRMSQLTNDFYNNSMEAVLQPDEADAARINREMSEASRNNGLANGGGSNNLPPCGPGDDRNAGNCF